MRHTLSTIAAAFVVLFGQGGGAPAVMADSQQSAAVEPPTEMTQYYVVFLRRGPSWTSAVTPETTRVSRGHMANIQRLTDEGTLVVAGPFLEQSGERALAGLFVLRVDSADEAKALVDGDPAVEAGRFVYEIVPWMGPKTLGY